MNKELGLHIESFEDYLITSKGDAWSLRRKKPRKLKPQKVTQSKKGYLQVRLFNEHTRRGNQLSKGVAPQKGQLHYVHRLVWETFVGEIPEGKEIDHIDGNPQNNNVDNLQVITRRENINKHWYPNRKVNLRLHRDEIIKDYQNLKTLKLVSLKWEASVQLMGRVIKNMYYVKVVENGKPSWLPRIYDTNIDDKWMHGNIKNGKLVYEKISM